MRVSTLFTFVFLWPMMTLADIQWHEFGRLPVDKETITIGHVPIIIEQQKDLDSGNPEDNLVLIVQKQNGYFFTSAYGYGSIAIYRNVLLLKYGVGRGTFARVDHVAVLRLDHDLDQLVDVQTSYYVLTNPHNAAPDLFEYHLNIQREAGYTTLSLTLSEPRYGLPSEKIIKWKDDE